MSIQERSFSAILFCLVVLPCIRVFPRDCRRKLLLWHPILLRSESLLPKKEDSQSGLVAQSCHHWAHSRPTGSPRKNMKRLALPSFTESASENIIWDIEFNESLCVYILKRIGCRMSFGSFKWIEASKHNYYLYFTTSLHFIFNDYPITNPKDIHLLIIYIHTYIY